MAVTMSIYCEGRQEAPHQRRILRRYSRAGGSSWLWLRAGDKSSLYDRYGESANKRGEFPDHQWHGHEVRLRCPDCGFDEQHKLTGFEGPEFRPFSEVFEQLHSHGVHEVSVRALAPRVAWPSVCDS